MSNTVRPHVRELHVHGKIPIKQHIPRSYVMLLRDGVVSRMKAFPFFSGFYFATSTAFRVMANHIPYAGIYFIDDNLTPDGLANSGEPRFHSMVKIGFSIQIQNNNPEEAEYKLDDAYQVITGGLFSDHTFYSNAAYEIQGFARGLRRHRFTSVGQNSELPVAELQFDLTIDLGAIIWEPLVPDMLERIHVKTVYPDDDPNRQPIISEYDLDQ